MDNVEELIKLVELDKNKHRASQHLRGRLFPFYTRNPERVKFNEPFMEIIGIISRVTLGYSEGIDSIEEQYLSNIFSQVEKGVDIQRNEVENLFSFDFSEINAPSMLKYYPIKHSETKELQGKILLAKYIIELFQLKSNQKWINYISKSHNTLTLYDEIVIKNLPEPTENISKKEEFHFFNQDKFIKTFDEDLSSMMENESFFMANIDLLFSYYLFYYIVQQTYQIEMVNREPFKMWFSFDKERVSKGRNAYRFGYKLVLDKAKDFLVNVDVIDYVNVLIGHEEVYTLDRVMNDSTLSSILLPRLIRFNQRFKSVIQDYTIYPKDTNGQIKHLKKMLKNSLRNEIQSRYSISFKEFSNLGFIRSRGRLGYVFSASQELLLLFVGVIIGNKEKILLKDFFNEMEERGLRFDTQSRREIIAYFERINILEKLSDSGDAQYVKSIL